MTEPVSLPDKSDVGTGAAIGVGLLAASQIPALYFGMFWCLFFGVTQLVAVVPGVIYLAVKGRRDHVKGVLLVAGIGFLLNSICTVIFMATFELH